MFALRSNLFDSRKEETVYIPSAEYAICLNANSAMQFAAATLPYGLFVRHLSEIRYCRDNGTRFHHFTSYIVSFADAHHIQFIFKE